MDLRAGVGAHLWPDGAKYEGEWAYGVQHGRGRYHWADGERTAWRMRMRTRTACTHAARVQCGAGALRARASALRACCPCNRDTRAHSPVRAHPLLSRSPLPPPGRKYEGDFAMGRRCGEGIATNANGRKFRGGTWESGQLVREVKLILEKHGPTKSQYASESRAGSKACAMLACMRAHAHARTRSRALSLLSRFSWQVGQLCGARAFDGRGRAPDVPGAPP
jgi:hypothetical protein